MAKDREEILLPLVIPAEVDPKKLEPPTHLSFSVFYDKGGADYYNGGSKPRGYYMASSPLRYADGMRSFIMGQGRKVFLEPTARFSAKRLSALAAGTFAEVRARAGKPWELATAVVKECKVTLAEDVGG